MTVNDVRKMEWGIVSDWSELTTTNFNSWNDAFVGEADVDCFVENIFKDVARKLDIAYAELEPIIKEENASFYHTKRRLFQRIEYVPKLHNRLLELEKMLRIPEIAEKHTKMICKPTVEQVLQDFSKLNDLEKLEVLEHLKLVSIKVKFLQN